MSDNHGLYRAGFDAMTAAEMAEWGVQGKVRECLGLKTRGRAVRCRCHESGKNGRGSVPVFPASMQATQHLKQKPIERILVSGTLFEMEFDFGTASFWNTEALQGSRGRVFGATIADIRGN